MMYRKTITAMLTGNERLITSIGETLAIPEIMITPAAIGEDTRPKVADTIAKKPKSGNVMPN